MYDVNKEKITELLNYMEEVLIIIKPTLDNAAKDDKVLNLAVERAMNIAIEVVVDVGNLIIDGFIMRDPGSYVDIIEILRDEEVLSNPLAEQLKKVVAYRKVLVHEYTTATSEVTFQLFHEGYSSLSDFGTQVQKYLDKELV